MRSGRVFEMEDASSIENNTNFKWTNKDSVSTVIKEQTIRVQGDVEMAKPEPVEAVDFYQQANFCIDELKDDFFEEIAGGWWQQKA